MICVLTKTFVSLFFIIIFAKVVLRGKTAVEISNKKRTLSLFSSFLHQGSQRIELHQWWYLRYLVTDSITSSAKSALTVVDLDQSHPAYHLLYSEWQNTVVQWNTGLLCSLPRKKNWRSYTRKAGDILKPYIPSGEVRAEKLLWIRLVKGGEGRGG